MMADFNGHHTLWECEEVNIRCQQLKDLILKNYLILFKNKCHTYFHSATGTFTSKDVVHQYFSLSPGMLVITLVILTILKLFWRMMDHLSR